MKILLVHNRYRSTAPSGENRVDGQESDDKLLCAGDDVLRDGEVCHDCAGRRMDLDPRRIFVKHNLVPYDGTYGRSPDRDVAYVGRLDQPKCGPLLLRAWDGYRENRRPIRAAAGDLPVRRHQTTGGS